MSTETLQASTLAALMASAKARASEQAKPVAPAKTVSKKPELKPVPDNTNNSTKPLVEYGTSELALEWKMVAGAVGINRSLCRACGNKTDVFAGYFAHLQHAKHRTASRWTACHPSDTAHMPKMLKVLETRADSCLKCAEKRGYPVEAVHG